MARGLRPIVHERLEGDPIDGLEDRRNRQAGGRSGNAQIGCDRGSGLLTQQQLRQHDEAGEGEQVAGELPKMGQDPSSPFPEGRMVSAARSLDPDQFGALGGSPSSLKSGSW
jgi:hypothetical protein